MDEVKNKWKAWVARFWWLRGVAAAIAVAGLVPEYMDLSRFEFLRAFHAFVVSWNDFMGNVGRVVGEFLSIPSIPALYLNGLVLFFSISVPLLFACNRSFSIKKKEKPETSELGELTFEMNRVCQLQMIFYAVPILLFSPIEHAYLSSVFVLLIELFFVAVCVFYFGLALVLLKGFGRGLFTVTSFVIALEVMYLLNVGGGIVNAWACETLEISKEEC